jgi:4-hydroxy-3-methylbut-2-en-1-yl diphosphate reductase
MVSRIGEGEGKVNAATVFPWHSRPWYSGRAMIVMRAETLGLCAGVRRALRLAEEALAANPGASFFSLGPLVHNRRLVEKLRARGITPVGELPALREGFLIVRTHGIGPAERRECERPGVSIIDATCPRVRRIHDEVLACSSRGFLVVVAGDHGHAEVKGIAAHAPRAAVVAGPNEAESLALDGPVLLVSQTTFDRGTFEEIRAALLRRIPAAQVLDTLCPETAEREDAVRGLAPKVDAFLVIGGRESANTRRLLAAAAASGLPSWQVEGAADIPAGIHSYARVGITAGASTPDFLVEEVEEALRHPAPAAGPGGAISCG